MRSTIFRSAILACLATTFVFAQGYQGGVRGAVTDSSGAFIANAKVTLTDKATNNLRSTLSNAEGVYVFNAVDPASYAMTAESVGFKKLERTEVIVGTQQFLTVDFKLVPGAVAESVLVTGEVPLIENSNASNGQVLDHQKMVDLPNLGRNPFLLAKLATNVVTAGDPRFNRFQDQSGSSQISIAGGPVRGNNYLIDGVPITDSYNRAVVIPSIEAVEEMKLQTGTYDAEMGRVGGGVFNAYMKSGSNQVHGSAFGYTRQTDWLANNFFYNRSGIARPETPYYTWGASLGGPVVVPKVYKGKNRTFFWLVLESYRQKSPLSGDFYVPTALERKGDFSASTVKIYDPLMTHACTAADACPSGVTVSRTQFANNIIPLGRLSTVGPNVASYFPLPTRTAATGSPNFTGVDTLTDRADEYTGKLDHEFTSWFRSSVSYLHYKSREPGGNPLQTLPGNGSYLLFRKVDATQVNATLTPNPTTVATFRWGFNRFPNFTTEVSQNFNPASLGFPTTFANAVQFQYFPQFTFQNAAGLSTISPSITAFYSRNFSANVSKYLGRHSLKAGFDYRIIHTDFLDGTSTAGTFALDDSFTRQFASTRTAGTGSDIASLLLGYASSGSVNQATKLYTYVNYYAGYINDDFRVNSRLTLNFGLRYEYETGVAEQNDHYVVGFDRKSINPLAAQGATGVTPFGQVLYAGLNGNPTSCCDASGTKFGPRAGAAFQVNSKTVIRGGWGIFYAPIRFSDDASLAVGYTRTTPFVATNDAFATPASTLDNPFPGGVLKPVGNTLGGLAGVGSNIAFLDQSRGNGLVQQYSFDIQRELPGKIALEVGYIGSNSRRLQPSGTAAGGININQLAPAFLPMGSALSASVQNPFFGKGGTGVIGGQNVTQAQLLLPYPEFGTVSALTDVSHARYDSMVVKAQKRLSAGLTFLSTFTWARSEDLSFASGNNLNSAPTTVQDYYNLQNEYSLSIVDVPLRFTTSVTYELPFGKGRRWMNGNRAADLLLGGWQFNSTMLYQSGFPLAISQSNLNAVIGAANQRPNATGMSPSMPGSVEDRIDDYINKAAFVDAARFTFGNVARTIGYRSPGYKNWDSSLFKDFTIHERAKAQFRAESLNLFNSPQFRSPGTNVDSSSFGKITSQANLPRILQLGFRVYF